MVYSTRFLAVYNTKEVRILLGGPNTDMNNYKLESMLLKNACKTVLKYEGSLFMY